MELEEEEKGRDGWMGAGLENGGGTAGLQGSNLCTSRLGGHSSPSGYQMSKTGCGINGNQGPVCLSPSPFSNIIVE